MKYREYPRLGESCYETTLENGLRIRVVPKRGFARKHAFLAVNYGSIDTRFTLDGRDYVTPDGVAHYLEHKMFDLPEENAMNLFAAYGGNPNAFTGYNMTAYYFDCTEQFEENLRLLLRMVMTPYFTEESVEKERGIIAREIQMYEDSPGSRLYEEQFRAMFAAHPVRVPIAGTVESIQAITAQTLYDCHAAFYQPGNMILCVAGDVDAETVVSLARELTPRESRPLPQRNYGPAEQMQCEAAATLQMPVSMPMFSLGFKCRPADHGDAFLRREIIGDLAAEILVGESSPLFERLYEEGLIDADFSAGYESVGDACIFSAGGDSRDPEAVAAAVRAELDRILTQGFDRALFDRLIKSSLGRRTRDLDSFENICYRMCVYELEGLDYFCYPEIYAGIRPEDVQAFLRDAVSREAVNLTRVLPTEE
ncbi:MAG: insulinase family protein [Oscillospiraceae bacterium]|nr:insulinase family protein [Oscillospiraceae bacterium]